MQESEVFSEEALQIVEETREVKRKGERKSYTQLNAEFQRIARRGKKAFYNEQCQEIEENITRGRARSSMRRRKISKKKVSKLSYLFSFPDWL